MSAAESAAIAVEEKRAKTSEEAEGTGALVESSNRQGERCPVKRKA